MPRNRSIRTALVALLLLAITGALAVPVAADTTATTGASVTVIDAGALDVAWSGDGVSFLADGSAPGVTSTEGVTAQATLSLAISDARSAENRAGYEVRISAGAFTISGTEHTIPASSLSIGAVNGLPDRYDAGQAIGAPLDQPVSILTVPVGADAIDTTIEIAVSMEIPAGTFPGAFSGGFDAEVLPLD